MLSVYFYLLKCTWAKHLRYLVYKEYVEDVSIRSILNRFQCTDPHLMLSSDKLDSERPVKSLHREPLDSNLLVMVLYPVRQQQLKMNFFL